MPTRWRARRTGLVGRLRSMITAADPGSRVRLISRRVSSTDVRFLNTYPLKTPAKEPSLNGRSSPTATTRAVAGLRASISITGSMPTTGRPSKLVSPVPLPRSRTFPDSSIRIPFARHLRSWPRERILFIRSYCAAILAKIGSETSLTVRCCRTRCRNEAPLGSPPNHHVAGDSPESRGSFDPLRRQFHSTCEQSGFPSRPWRES